MNHMMVSRNDVDIRHILKAVVLLLMAASLDTGQGLCGFPVSEGDSVTSYNVDNRPHLRPIMVDSTLFSGKLPQINLEFEYTPDRSLKQFYNPKNVLPKNPLFLDYRGSSYYTPKIVQDRLDFIMNRPRADSFVPIPVVAMLAANIAMKYIDIEKKMEITAKDYLLDEPFLSLLYTLWQKTPSTAGELYRQDSSATDKTYLTLEEHLEFLIGKKLVKSREMEAGETLYYPAQPSSEVIKLLEKGLIDSTLTENQRTRLAHLLTRLKE